MFLLVNNYRDGKSLPYVVSSEKFQTNEILDAGIDTADETTLPTAQDILDDVNVGVGLDFEDEYFDCWGVTDHYSSCPISLVVGEDLVLKNDRGSA